MRRSVKRLSILIAMIVVGGLATGCGTSIGSSVQSAASSLATRTATAVATPTTAPPTTAPPTTAVPTTAAPVTPTTTTTETVTATATAAPPTTANTTPAVVPSGSPAASGSGSSNLLWLWILLGAIVLIVVILLIVRSSRRRSATEADWRARLTDVYAKGSALHDAMSVAETAGGMTGPDAGARWADIQRRADDLAQTLYALRDTVPDQGDRDRIADTLVSLQAVRSAMDAERAPGGAGPQQAEVVRNRLYAFEASLQALRAGDAEYP
jgi:hypothetical protein